VIDSGSSSGTFAHRRPGDKARRSGRRPGGPTRGGRDHDEGSPPGLGVHVNDVVGVVPSPDDPGDVVIGSDGGTLVFGDATFAGSPRRHGRQRQRHRRRLLDL